MEVKNKPTDFRSRKRVFRPLNEKTLAENSSIPPYDEKMEQAVLGSILLEIDAFNLVKQWLKESVFYLEKHKILLQSILSLQENSMPIDVVSCIKHLRENNLLEKAGGRQYLASLVTIINSAANIEHHVQVLVQLATKREMIKVSADIIKDSYDQSFDVFDLLNKTEQSFFTISEKNIKKNYLDSKTIMRLTIEELESKKLTSETGITGIPSGFTELDNRTGGWQKSELTIIAARPGMGKTAFVVSAMTNAAIHSNTPVAIFSLEMSATQLMLRMISSEAEIESDKLRKGNLKPYEWQQLNTRLDKLSKAPIYIDDTPALSILELRAKCRRLKAQHNISMVIIDYLQLMSGDEGNGLNGNREQEIAAISRSLKNLAKELDAPVIALSQLSRAVETRGGDKKPQLSDLRESGSIEQDADMVMFLYRPEYYKINEYEDGSPTAGMAELILAKNRAGTLDTINLQFHGAFTKFTNPGELLTEAVPSNYLSSLSSVSGLEDFEKEGKIKDEDIPF